MSRGEVDVTVSELVRKIWYQSGSVGEGQCITVRVVEWESVRWSTNHSGSC